MGRFAFIAAFATALVASAAPAHADAVVAEAGGGVAHPSATLPSSSFAYAKVGARLELGETVTASASARVVHDFPVAASSGDAFRTGDDWVVMPSLGVAWDVSVHFSLALDLSGSPPSSREFASSLVVAPARADVRSPLSTSSLVTAKNANAGATLTATYDSYDEDADRDLDVAVDVSAGATGFATTQALSALDTPSGVFSQPDLADRCRTALTGLACAAATVPSHSTWLTQLRFGVTPTLTIAQRTDVSVDAAIYVYDVKQPGDVGFFDDAVGGRTVSWGTGVPLLPPRWSLRPELGQRIGDHVSLRGYYQYTDTTLANVATHTIGGRAQLAFDGWKPYATGSVRFDAGDGESTSWTAGLGLTRSF